MTPGPVGLGSRPAIVALAALLFAVAASREGRAQSYIPEPLTSAREYYAPPLADPTEPSYGGRLIYPPGGNRYGEITIGDYVGLTRWRVLGMDTQLNIGGGAIARFNLTTPQNNLEVVDFSAGMPLDVSVAKGKTLRLAYWHVSSHLGDDYIARIRKMARGVAEGYLKLREEMGFPLLKGSPPGRQNAPK